MHCIVPGHSFKAMADDAGSSAQRIRIGLTGLAIVFLFVLGLAFGLAVAMAVVGDASPLWKGAAGNPGDGTWQRSWLYYHAASIWAGTNEIQRTIVGERVLGLPRD